LIAWGSRGVASNDVGGDVKEGTELGVDEDVHASVVRLQVVDLFLVQRCPELLADELDYYQRSG